MMKQILFISEYGTASVSGFIGSYIYEDLFKKHGFQIDFYSRNIPSSVKIVRKTPLLIHLITRSKITSLFNLLKKLITLILEINIIRKAKNVDIICLLKVNNLHFIERLKTNTHAKIVLYFGDAIWVDNNRFPEVLTLVHGVITDNDYTADYAKRYNQNCYVVPDSPQIELFDRSRDKVKKSDSNNIVLGWVGSPTTVYNLYVIWEALEKIFSKYSNLHLRLIGTGNDLRLLPLFENVNYSILPFYSQDEMIEEVLKMDIGLFPLQNTERSRVRGILKSCVYMSGETAVIASAVGQVADLIDDGVNGVLVYNNSEWETKLEKLINDEVLRKKIAKNGLETVRREYSLEQNFKKLLKALEQTSL